MTFYKNKTKKKGEEHSFQEATVAGLRRLNCITVNTDVMFAMKFLGNNQTLRLRFWNYARRQGYTNGTSDVIVIMQNEVLFVEIKRPTTYKISEKTGKRIIDKKGGVQKEDQKIFQKAIEEMGHKYFLIDSDQKRQDLYTYISRKKAGF